LAKADGTAAYGMDVEPPRLAQWPQVYQDYQLLPESQSPDGRYGFIYPKRTIVEEGTDSKLFLIEQRPFRMVAEIPIEGALLADNAHGAYQVNWARNSSSVVFVVGTKWGPEAVFLIPLARNQCGPIVNLAAEIRKLIQPSYRQSNSLRFNDYFDFIFESEDYICDDRGKSVDTTTSWTVNDKNQVEITCIGTTDPKHLGPNIWEVIFHGVWDIGRSTFVRHEFTRIDQNRLPRF